MYQGTLQGVTEIADVAELVDALVLGTSVERRGGSSPFIRTSLMGARRSWRGASDCKSDLARVSWFESIRTHHYSLRRDHMT